MRLLLFLFFALEIALLIVIGGAVGVLMTLLEFVLSAMFGSYIIREKGFRFLVEMNQQIKQGIAQDANAISAIVNVVAGLLLIIPGFASDTIGLLLLIPLCRNLLKQPAQWNINHRARRNRQKRARIIIDQTDD